jgi:hypothetical protein
VPRQHTTPIPQTSKAQTSKGDLSSLSSCFGVSKWWHYGTDQFVDWPTSYR